MRRFLACLLFLFTPAAGLWFAAQTPTHIVVVHTNDLHGQLLPKNGVGGIAEIASVIRAAKPDLIFDAGDIFTGTFLSDEFKGEPTIAAMNMIGYTSSTIGNHEFDYGQEALRMRLRQAKFPVLSANLTSPISEIKKYTIVTVKGIRFGIIGLTTVDLKTKGHPKNLGGVTVVDTVKALEQILPEVRSKSDFIIATVHLENSEDRRVASAFPEIRLIIGGHTHLAVGPIQIGRTLVVKTGVSGANVGRVDLDFNSKSLARMSSKLIPVARVPADPELTKVLEPFNERVKVRMAEVVGEAADDLASSKTAESPLADLVADAFREKGKTQIALHNIGGIRSKIVKGRITWGNVFEVLPFQNTLITLKLTGAQLKKSLERGLVPEIGLTAFSGLRVRFDRTKPAGARVVSALLPDGTPVDDSKLYTVTTNDFVLAGGDGYTELAKGTDIVDTGIFLRDVLTDYIRSERVLRPRMDGRIMFE